MKRTPVIVIGGGVSGLTASFYLERAGVSSLLLEKSPRLGGLIRTDLIEGCRLEGGPDSFISTKPGMSALASHLAGLKEQFLSSNDAARKVFIVREGQLVPFPSGMSMMVPGKLLPALRSELFGVRTKLRFIGETFIKPKNRTEDISVGQLVTEHFGSEVLEYVADPLLVGVYGGNAAELSAASVLPRFMSYEQTWGSLMKGVRSESSSTPKSGLFLSFRDGMQTLTDSLSHAIREHSPVCSEQVMEVSRSKGRWLVQTRREQYEADSVVLACPARIAAKLVAKAAPELASELGAITYSSAILVTLVYRTDELQHELNGFGFLVPRAERQTIAAATWINTKFPSRIAPGLTAIRAFIVAGEAIRLSDQPDSELAALAHADLRKLMGLKAAPQFSIITRWPDSMPQYVVGHKARLQRISELLALQPRLSLIGNSYSGVGIQDCIQLAAIEAESIIKSL